MKYRINPVIMCASQRCPRWWLWGSELRGRSRWLGPKWWAALTSRPKLLWVKTKKRLRTNTLELPDPAQPVLLLLPGADGDPVCVGGSVQMGRLQHLLHSERSGSSSGRGRWEFLFCALVRACVRVRVQGSVCLVGFSTCRFSLSLRPRSAVSGLSLTSH